MDNQYIRELIEILERTEIWQGSGQGEKCADYDEGIKLLVETFTKHKVNQSQLFFLGNGGSSAIASHMTCLLYK